jgi:hypothetical protein
VFGRRGEGIEEGFGFYAKGRGVGLLDRFGLLFLEMKL